MRGRLSLGYKNLPDLDIRHMMSKSGWFLVFSRLTEIGFCPSITASFVRLEFKQKEIGMLQSLGGFGIVAIIALVVCVALICLVVVARREDWGTHLLSALAAVCFFIGLVCGLVEVIKHRNHKSPSPPAISTNVSQSPSTISGRFYFQITCNARGKV